MPRKMGVLAFSILLFLASLGFRWYVDGRWSAHLNETHPRVMAALQYLSSHSASANLIRSGSFMRAWGSETRDGYQVFVAVELGSNPYLAFVRFDSGGSPATGGHRLWTEAQMPRFFLYLSIGFFVLWVLAAFVAPHVFGVKCPDCPQSFISPVLTEVKEATVYPRGFARDGSELNEIVRRDYVCPRCGYTKITYYVAAPHSGGFWARPIRHWTGIGMYLNIKETEWYDRVLNRYLSSREAGQYLTFPTWDEWKAFYDELKASEREERPSPI